MSAHDGRVDYTLTLYDTTTVRANPYISFYLDEAECMLVPLLLCINFYLLRSSVCIVLGSEIFSLFFIARLWLNFTGACLFFYTLHFHPAFASNGVIFGSPRLSISTAPNHSGLETGNGVSLKGINMYHTLLP